MNASKPCGVLLRSDHREFRGSDSHGVTLIELLVVVAIVGLMISISYPTLTSGLDGFRLRSALDEAGAFVQQARSQADRRQQPVQLTVDFEANRMSALAADSGWQDTLDFGAGVRVVEPAQMRSWMVFPATPPPQVRMLLETRTGSRKGISVNVLTGLAEDWQGPAE